MLKFICVFCLQEHCVPEGGVPRAYIACLPCLSRADEAWRAGWVGMYAPALSTLDAGGGR